MGRVLKKAYFIIISLILLGALLLLFGGKYCLTAKNELFYPTIVNTVPPVSNDLGNILLEFETILKEKNEKVYNSLNQGLTADDIHQLETKYSVKLPEEITALYMWHNGCGDFNNGLTNGSIIPGHWFVPLEQALEMSKSVQSDTTFVQKLFYEVFAGHRKGWIVLLDDGCGDGYFYDPARSSGAGYVFYHFAEIGHYVFFPSLKNMFQAFIECYQNDVFNFDNEMNIQAYETEKKIMSKYGLSVNLLSGVN